jgi:hypothetical protein
MSQLSMTSLTDQVLPFRSPKYIQEFHEKLAQQGICVPVDFLGLSKDAFDKKAKAFPDWNFIEVADAVSMHQAVAGKGRGRAKAKGRGRRGRGGGPARGHGWLSGEGKTYDWVWVGPNEYRWSVCLNQWFQGSTEEEGMKILQMSGYPKRSCLAPNQRQSASSMSACVRPVSTPNAAACPGAGRAGSASRQSQPSPGPPPHSASTASRARTCLGLQQALQAEPVPPKGPPEGHKPAAKYQIKKYKKQPVPPKGPPPNNLIQKYLEKEQKTDQSSSMYPQLRTVSDLVSE